MPARWPDYNNLSFSSKPAWWNPALKEIYIFESWVNSGSFHQDRSEGRAYFPDYSEKVIFIWYWNIQWWGIR